jgi:hypothetical protein
VSKAATIEESEGALPDIDDEQRQHSDEIHSRRESHEEEMQGHRQVDEQHDDNG